MKTKEMYQKLVHRLGAAYFGIILLLTAIHLEVTGGLNLIASIILLGCFAILSWEAVKVED